MSFIVPAIINKYINSLVKILSNVHGIDNLFVIYRSTNIVAEI